MDFLSHAAIVGFMGGAAIVIGLQQLKGLLGISHFTSKTDVVSVLKAVFRSLHDQVSFFLQEIIHSPFLYHFASVFMLFFITLNNCQE